MKGEKTPRIEIDLQKIAHNAKRLTNHFREKGIGITGVVKGVCASPEVARIFVESGMTTIADTKIANLRKLKKEGFKAELILLRTPAISEAAHVVQYADISMNTELDVIRTLSAAATSVNKKHRIILMVEMGDLREGILPDDLPSIIQQVLPLEGVQIVGIGANFACFGGVIPTEKKMNEFSTLANRIQKEFSLAFKYISGGNSANYEWFTSTPSPGAINHLRLGEAILLGRETVRRKPIPGLYTDAFRLIAEVIESKIKPSVPDGEIGSDAFGEIPSFIDRGTIRRTIVGIGRQDVFVSGLTPRQPVEILGASSDHIILDAKHMPLKPGDEVSFSLNYGALLSAMTSPYVHKKYLPANINEQYHDVG